MTKRELERQLSDLGCTIQHILKGNQVVIERYEKWGVTVQELIEDYVTLQTQYKKRWGYLLKKKENNLEVSI